MFTCTPSPPPAYLSLHGLKQGRSFLPGPNSTPSRSLFQSFPLAAKVTFLRYKYDPFTSPLEVFPSLTPHHLLDTTELFNLAFKVLPKLALWSHLLPPRFSTSLGKAHLYSTVNMLGHILYFSP